MKKIFIGVAQVFGATEVAEATIALKTAKVVYRSDYLDKLEEALASSNEKMQIPVGKIRTDAPSADHASEIVGYDSDHPYLTKELPAKKSEGRSEIVRAWRYVAVIA